MDKLKIINKYKQLKNLTKQGSLADGGAIVGMEIDENNFLHYVVKRGNDISVEEAQHTTIADIEHAITINRRVHSGN